MPVGDEKASSPPITFIERYWVIKTVLRVCLVVLDTGAICCKGVIINGSGPVNHASRIYSYLLLDNAAAAFAIVSCCISILWCSFVTYSLLFRRSSRFLRLRTNSGSELVLFLFLFISFLLSVLGMRGLVKASDMDSYVIPIADNSVLEEMGHHSLPDIISCCLQAVAMALHLILFLWTCITIAQRRRSRRKAMLRNVQEKTKGPQHTEMLGDIQFRTEMSNDTQRPVELAQLLPGSTQSSLHYSLVELPADEHSPFEHNSPVSTPQDLHKEKN